MKKRIILILLTSLMTYMSIICNAQEIQGMTIIDNVPVIKQFPELPTGCEATALTMLLQHHGAHVSKLEVADSIPRVKLPVKKGGNYVGFHPNEGFIGNPYTKYSYGVFAKPLIGVIDAYFPNRVLNLTGKSLDEILEYVKNGQPVMIWVTINMLAVTYNSCWKLQDNTLFKWPGNEHAVVVVGYDENNIFINDPYTGKMQRYKKKIVQDRYIALGQQALAIQKQIDDETYKIIENRVQIPLEEVLKKAYIKEDHIFIPLNYLPYVTDKIKYSYMNNIVSFEMDGYIIDIDLSKENGTVALSEEITIYYEYKEGVTYIDIASLKTAIGFEDNILEMTIVSTNQP